MLNKWTRYNERITLDETYKTRNTFHDYSKPYKLV